MFTGDVNDAMPLRKYVKIISLKQFCECSFIVRAMMMYDYCMYIDA